MRYNIPMKIKAGYITSLLIFFAAMAFAGPLNITAKELKSMTEGKETALIIDVRTIEEFNEGHIPGAVPLESVRDLKALSNETRVILYCNTGRRSEKAMELFLEKGIAAVELEGGIKAWVAAGGNVVAGPYRDISDYPKTFEIPKGVCEPHEPAIKIGE